MTNDPIWRLPDVMAYTGLARSTIYHKISQHDFPRSTSLGPRAIGWRASWIEQWVQGQIEASLPDDNGVSADHQDLASTPLSAEQ